MNPVPAAASVIPVAIIDSDQATRHRLAMQVGERAIPFPSVEAFVERLTGAPMVMVLGPSCAVLPGLGGGEQIVAERREVGAIVVSDELNTELFQRAMRIGVRDVLEAPVDTSQLNEAIRRVATTLEPYASTGNGTGSIPGVIGVDDPEGPGGGGRVITVFSTKGGAGKSVVASNVAVTLATRSEKPVVLVDADLQFGDIAVMLKLAPQHTIVDAVSSIDRLDPNLLQSLLVRHQPSGLYVLPAPLEPAFADQIGGAEMSRIISLLRQWAGYVVVDTPAYFNEVVLGLIEESDDVLLVAGMDIPNIKNVKIGLQTMRLLNTPMQKIHLVLNRANSKVKLDVGEVERTLQVKAESLLPSEIAVPQSVNKGMPVVLDAPRSSISKALDALAEQFLAVEERQRKRR